MSTKIKKQLEEVEKKFIIDDTDFSYLTNLDNVQRGSDYWFNQLKTEYIKQVAVKLGYSLEDKLEFSIDLKSPDKELTIKKLS
jgi:hypothetical protein